LNREGAILVLCSGTLITITSIFVSLFPTEEGKADLGSWFAYSMIPVHASYIIIVAVRTS